MEAELWHDDGGVSGIATVALRSEATELNKALQLTP